MPDELAAEIARLTAESPVPVDARRDAREPRARARRSTPGCAACEHEIVARMDADDVSLPDRFEKQLPADRGGRRHRRLGALEFGASIDDVVGRRTPPDGPRRDPPRRPLPRPVQPPDRGLPAQRGPGRRRVRRHGADGGLPAVHPDGRGRCRAGQPGRAAGPLPGRRRRLRPPRRVAAAALRARPAAPVPRAGPHHARPVPAQRGRPRRLPARPGGCEKGRVPPPVSAQRARRRRLATSHAASRLAACRRSAQPLRLHSPPACAARPQPRSDCAASPYDSAPTASCPDDRRESAVERRTHARPRRRRIRVLRTHHRRALRE